MSSRYTANGKRLSSMTHARRGHHCDFCDYVAFGNGGQVSHARKHVREGKAVELLKEFATYPPMSTRRFLAIQDPRIPTMLADGFRFIESRWTRVPRPYDPARAS